MTRTKDEHGFMKIPRQDPGYRLPDDRKRDFNDVAKCLSEDELRAQADRCMGCGIPFCHSHGCPVENCIPEFNELAHEGRWRAAYDVLESTNPFPEFTGRICPAPCETSCVLGINDDPVAIRQIELAVIEKAFAEGWVTPKVPVERFAKKVAVVGSGPAGLAAAYRLNRAGYLVTVYEAAPKPGGILQYGIPNFKLEKSVVDRRIDVMQQEGVIFECGVRVGDDVSYKFIHDRFDAIVLTGGARAPRDLAVPGRTLSGVEFAMDFLTQQTLKLEGTDFAKDKIIDAAGKNVLVIGGGDTGSDCVGTSNRQGAKSITQVEILPKPPEERDPSTPWPEWPKKLRTSSSHEEGCKRDWCVTTQRLIGDEHGQLKQAMLAKVEWLKTENGQWQMREIEGSEYTIDVELVLLAMGFTGPGPNQVVELLDLELDSRGNVKRFENNQTSAPGVFVAGDMTFGASLVVRAIKDGQDAARGVLHYLAE